LWLVMLLLAMVVDLILLLKRYMPRNRSFKVGSHRHTYVEIPIDVVARGWWLAWHPPSNALRHISSAC
jgi:hypothetical protein